MVKTQTRKCPVCGEEYPYPYVHFRDEDYPETCGSLTCKRNWEYMKAHKDLQGNMPDPKEIKKW